MNNDFMNRVNAIRSGNQPQPQPQSQDEYGAFAEMVPRQAQLMNEPHMLAYINPQEEQMLRDMGGAGIPGPDGIPVYGWLSDTWSEITSGGNAVTETYNSGGSSAPTTSVRPVARPQSVVDKYANTAVPGSNSGGNTGGNTVSTVVKPAVVKPAVVKPVEVKTPDYQGKNAFREDLANFFTPFDSTIYHKGNLVDKKSYMPATNIGTKTFYGTVGNANDPNTGSYKNPDMSALQTPRSERGKVGSVIDHVVGNLPGTALSLITGAPIGLANAFGEWEVGPNPRDDKVGTGGDGQDIYENADGKYYSKGMFGNYYFVNSATDSTPISESNESSALDDMLAANNKSNNQSAALSAASGGAGGGAGGGSSQGPTYYDYERRRKGGGYAMLPDYLKKYIKAGKIDETVRKIVLADGREMYVTPEGRLLDPEDLKNTSVSDEVIRYDTDGNLIA